MKYLNLHFAFMLLILISCKPVTKDGTSFSANSVATDPLPSWVEGETKKAIVEFITRTTLEGSPEFIPVNDRIACFDNDGTLWSEQPIYFQLAFTIDRVKVMAPEHPG